MVANQIVVSHVVWDSDMVASLFVSDAQQFSLLNISLDHIHSTQDIVITSSVQFVEASGVTVTNCTCPTLIQLSGEEESFQASHWIIQDSSFVPFSATPTMELSSLVFSECST